MSVNENCGDSEANLSFSASLAARIFVSASDLRHWRFWGYSRCLEDALLHSFVGSSAHGVGSLARSVAQGWESSNTCRGLDRPAKCDSQAQERSLHRINTSLDKGVCVGHSRESSQVRLNEEGRLELEVPRGFLWNRGAHHMTRDFQLFAYLC